MSDYSASTSNKGKGRRRNTSRGISRSNSEGEVHLHALTDGQAAIFRNRGRTFPLQEIKKKSGADVEFDPHPSPLPGMKIIIIRGERSQIEAAVSLISQKTGAKGTLSEQTQEFWMQWAENAFRGFESRAYFLPPVHVNRVPARSESIGGQNVLVLQQALGGAGQSQQTAMISSSVDEATAPQPPLIQDSDIRDDAAMQRIFYCLQRMSEQTEEVFFGISQLKFRQYLGEACYAAASAQLPLATSLPREFPQNWKHGDFDILLIHRVHGLVVCEIKTFGDNVEALGIPQQQIDKNIRTKLTEAAVQLTKAEAMLSHLVSDIAPGLRITKTIAFPNLTTRQVQQAVHGDGQLIQTLCECLGTTDPDGIPGLCLCSNQLFDPRTPGDVSRGVLKKLKKWWKRRVAVSGCDETMSCDVYRTLVARFCGPATTVTVPCTFLPRICIKTLGEAVSFTGECYTSLIALFPEQVHLLHTAPQRLFITGPPGTGKTVVLLLMAIQWLRCGHHVYVVNSWKESRSASSMIHDLLLQTVKTLRTQQTSGETPGEPHLLRYDFDGGKDVEKAVSFLSQESCGGPLYVIADEVSEFDFATFCGELLKQVPCLHLWAASCFHENAPVDWQVEYLTRPLRSPPVIVREVEQDAFIVKYGYVKEYSERGVPDHTDGPPVRQLYHRGQGHSGRWPGDCVMCGREVANVLRSFPVGVAENTTCTAVTPIRCGTTPPCLQWRDVLVLYVEDFDDKSGMVNGLRRAGIPVQVMKDDDTDDVATARSDVVWAANGNRVRGLERKIIVCVQTTGLLTSRLHLMSRCTSQLVIVSPDTTAL